MLIKFQNFFGLKLQTGHLQCQIGGLLSLSISLAPNQISITLKLWVVAYVFIHKEDRTQTKVTPTVLSGSLVFIELIEFPMCQMA